VTDGDDTTNEIGGGDAIRCRGESVSAAAPHSMLTVETGPANYRRYVSLPTSSGLPRKPPSARGQ
jgi:hypothetical protein